jgi:hypothetical protein
MAGSVLEPEQMDHFQESSSHQSVINRDGHGCDVHFYGMRKTVPLIGDRVIGMPN